MKWILEKLRRLFMLNLSAVKTAKKEPAIVKPKADAPKKRGRPKGNKKKK